MSEIASARGRSLPVQQGRPAALARQTVAGIAVLLAAAVVGVRLDEAGRDLPWIWVLGLAFGAVLQRSRFCFASAFRDLFLFGQSRVMRGILAGLAVTAVGFAVLMFTRAPVVAAGVLPDQAHILPLGSSTVLGGLLFGFGMVLAGGCVSGSLYRMAEGYVGSWVAVGGVMIGLGVIAQTWNWWWERLISAEPRPWLPQLAGLGYGGALLLVLLALLAAFVGLLWWEARAGLPPARRPAPPAPDPTVRGQLAALWRAIFVQGWSPVAGGIVLGALNVLLYAVHMPWGVTGEVARWANGLMALAGVAPPVARGLSEIGGCAARADEAGLFTHTFAVTVGLLAGALAAALLAGEFKPRVPPRPVRYVQALGGGISMGLGAGLALGCTIGSFFSAIPSLALSGWLFALALGGGAFLGVQAIQRIR